jgi:GGDEF domain-containing protein/transcriptional regulator with GAF, ATPase, and Fis domain
MTTGKAEQSGLALICEVGAAITSSLVLEDVLTSVAQRVAEAFDVWECDFYEYDAVHQKLIAAACWSTERGSDDDAWVGQVFEVCGVQGLDRVVQDREILEECVDDAQLSEADVGLFDAWGEKSAISVPLVFEDEVLGCLSLIEKREVRHFSEEERELLRTLALPAAVAIHNAKVYRRLENRARQLGSLLDASRALATSVVLDDILAMVARKTGEALDVPSCLIYEYVIEADALALRSACCSASSSPVKHALGTLYPFADYPDDREILDGGQIVEQHVCDETLDVTTRRSMLDNAELSCLSVPIEFEGESLGIVEIIETRYDRSFSAGELDLARGLMEQAAAAIHNARLYRRLEEQNDRLGTLNGRLSAFLSLSEQMRGLVDEGQMLHLLGRVMHEVLDYRQWAAYMYDGEERVFHVVSSIGGAASAEAGQTGRAIPAPVIEGLIVGATPMSRSYFVDHRVYAWTDEQHFWLPAEELGDRAPDEWHWDDTLFVPMVSELGELLGYFEAYDPVDRRLPNVEDVRLLEVFATKASSDIELHRLYEQLAEQARTDGLTGLTNHRHFMECLDDEVAKARRYGTPLSLLMLDLDDFKPFNDTYGHPQGDKLLRGVAGILRGTTRDRIDLVARYGGEEFVVLLPSTPAAGATATGERIVHDVSGDPRDAVGVAETIRRMMAESLFEGFPSRDEVHVTMSVGVATFPDHADSAFELIVNADKALYLAKRMGKNRVRVFD